MADMHTLFPCDSTTDSTVTCVSLQPIIAGFETSDDFHEKMEVCKVCGCFLVINDAPQRIQSHLEGKQHMGYARIRSKIEELQVSGLWCCFRCNYCTRNVQW